jgi:hypothetical protein
MSSILYVIYRIKTYTQRLYYTYIYHVYGIRRMDRTYVHGNHSRVGASTCLNCLRNVAGKGPKMDVCGRYWPQLITLKGLRDIFLGLRNVLFFKIGLGLGFSVPTSIKVFKAPGYSSVRGGRIKSTHEKEGTAFQLRNGINQPTGHIPYCS